MLLLHAALTIGALLVILLSVSAAAQQRNQLPAGEWHY